MTINFHVQFNLLKDHFMYRPEYIHERTSKENYLE
jgi:hypothetical protein